MVRWMLKFILKCLAKTLILDFTDLDIAILIWMEKHIRFFANMRFWKMGKVHQVDLKRSWLRISSYLELQYGNDLLKAYSVSKGTDTHICIYRKEEQIAQIEKSTIIHNDLHYYDIYASDQLSAIEAVLFSVYGYVISCFKPGEKVTKSYCKYYHTTTDPFLLSKYHPEFLKEWEEKKSET